MGSGRWRSTLLLALVLALIAGGGLVGVLTARAATAKAVEVHRADRVAFRAVVGKLVYGYFATAFAALDERAGSAGFSLQPGDRGDVVRLRQTVDNSLFFGEGAVLTDLGGHVVTSYLRHGPVPPITDPGYVSMIRELTQGRPGMSAILPASGDRKLLALAVPVQRDGANAGLLVGFIRMDGTGPTKQFLEGLPLGRDVHLYTVDPRGVIGGSTEEEDIGRPAPPAHAAALAVQGDAGLITDTRDGTAYVDAFAPIGLGGWSVLIDEPSNDFLGPIEARGTEVQVSLIVLLVLAAAVVSVLHHRRQLALQQLADQALRDPLTGLPNRILFRSRLDASLTPSSMPPGGVALLFCDLDGFKQVNDGYGHAAGDELLVHVGERLRGCVRDADLVARIGGDEFTVLLDGGADTPEQTEQRADEVARRVVERLAAPIDVGLGRPPVRIGVSIGVCVLGPDEVARGGGVPDVLKLADDAMYRAKSRRQGPERAVIGV